MASEWPVLSLGEVINLKRGYDLAARERQPGRVPIISSSGETGTHSRAMVAAPGVVTGRYGTIGLVHYVEEPFWPLNTTLYVQDFKGNDPRFVYYLLKTIRYRDYLDKAAVPGINRNDVHMAQVALPPILEQRQIAQIMRCIDERMEYLQKENSTIEAIARAIFKSWFVDFDPVRAKAEGREPEGMDADAAALFPSEFEETPLGPVPCGWSVVNLGDLAEFAYGKPLKAENRNGGTFPVIGSNGMVGWHDEALVSGPGIVVGRKGNPGTVTWVDSDFFPIDTTFFVRPRNLARGLHILKNQLDLLNLPDLSADSAVPGLNREIAYQTKLANPPKHIAKLFEDVVEPLVAKAAQNEGLVATLADLRDTLLPRLISGKLRVPEAEAMLMAV